MIADNKKIIDLTKKLYPITLDNISEYLINNDIEKFFDFEFGKISHEPDNYLVENIAEKILRCRINVSSFNKIYFTRKSTNIEEFDLYANKPIPDNLFPLIQLQMIGNNPEMYGMNGEEFEVQSLQSISIPESEKTNITLIDKLSKTCFSHNITRGYFLGSEIGDKRMLVLFSLKK